MTDDPTRRDSAPSDGGAKVVERPSPLTGLARAAISLGAGAFLVIREVTDLAFVYRNGVIMLMPEAEVKEESQLVVYDLRAASAPLTNFQAPAIGVILPSNYQPADDVAEAVHDGGVEFSFSPTAREAQLQAVDRLPAKLNFETRGMRLRHVEHDA